MSAARSSLPWLALLLPIAAAAQSPRWQLPSGGAARYEADERWTCTRRDAPHENAGPPFGQLPHLPILLACELTTDGRTTTVRHHDIRWLAARLAFDLTTCGPEGTLDITFDDVSPFAALRVQGRAEAVDASGTQKLFCRITTPPRAVQPLPGAGRPAPAGGQDAETCWGTLILERRFDAKAGQVTGFTADLKLRVDPGARHPNRETDFDLHQVWTLREVLPRRDPTFAGRVAAAVRRGAEHVRRELVAPDRGLLAPRADESHGEGYLALVLLTLLHADVSSNDPVIRQGFAELRRREVRETYPLGIALSAMDRLYTPSGEREQLLSGALDRPGERKLDVEDTKTVARWTKALLANRDTEVRPEYQTRWRYSGPGFDNSNTQYGVLGLHAADSCGAKVGRTVWFAVTNHWLAVQCAAEGPAVPLALAPIDATHGTSARAPQTRSQQRASPRGWDYGTGTMPPYGGMVTAGIASLTIALSHLQNSAGKVDAGHRQRSEQAIRDGFAWLARWYAPRRVPGPAADHATKWWYYHLYGLERACELSNVGTFDGHDWYHDHALLLLEAQEADGGWGRLADTCWAILFLKKGQLPVFTHPR